MAGKLQRTPSRRVEGRDLDHRRDNQFPGDLPAIRKDTLASPLNLDTRALGEAVPSNLHLLDASAFPVRICTKFLNSKPEGSVVGRERTLGQSLFGSALRTS